MKTPKRLLAGTMVIMGMAMVAPSAFAASPTSVHRATASAVTPRVGVLQKVASDLGLSLPVVRQSLANAGLRGLADAMHETVATEKRTLRHDHLLHGVDRFLARHRRVKRGVRIGLAAVAKSLNLKPRQMLKEARQHKLELPSGTTAQSLEATADFAVQRWLSGLAHKPPKLTATQQANLAKTIDGTLTRVLSKIVG